MSQARVYVTAKVRKDWTCGKCGAEIKKGIDGRRSFAVGFRGREQTRCMKTECTPTRGELESSATAPIYDAIDSLDLTNLDSVEDIEEAVHELAESVREVIDEYESNEMYDVNEQLQDRVATLESAADEFESWAWDGDVDPGEETDCDECEGTGTVMVVTNENPEPHDEDCEACEGTGTVSGEDGEAAREEWLESVRAAALEAVEGVELP